MSVTLERGSHASLPISTSVKGVIIRNRTVVLLRNERGEWELPGGKLEDSEQAERCVVREVSEELGLDIEPVDELAPWLYVIGPRQRVQIRTFGCRERIRRDAVLSDEHRELGWFALDEVNGLVMPDGYKRSVSSWAAALDQKSWGR